MFLDRSKDFFEILAFEKEKWADFYFEYIKNAPSAFALYHNAIRLEEEQIRERLLSFERRYLDKCYQAISSLAPYEYETARKVVEIAKEKKLDLSRLRIYIVGALNFETIYKLDEDKIFVDVLSLFRVGFSELPKLVSEKLS
jgi:L-methionine (R)-S-oxide reductase